MPPSRREGRALGFRAAGTARGSRGNEHALAEGEEQMLPGRTHLLPPSFVRSAVVIERVCLDVEAFGATTTPLAISGARNLTESGTPTFAPRGARSRCSPPSEPKRRSLIPRCAVCGATRRARPGLSAASRTRTGQRRAPPPTPPAQRSRTTSGPVPGRSACVLSNVVVPRATSRTYTPAIPSGLPSPRFPPVDANATRCPSAEMAGSVWSPSPGSPRAPAARLTSTFSTRLQVVPPHAGAQALALAVRPPDAHDERHVAAVGGQRRRPGVGLDRPVTSRVVPARRSRT